MNFRAKVTHFTDFCSHLLLQKDNKSILTKNENGLPPEFAKKKKTLV